MQNRFVPARKTLTALVIGGPLAVALTACGSTAEPTSASPANVESSSPTQGSSSTPPPVITPVPETADVADGTTTTKLLLTAAATAQDGVPESELVSIDRDGSTWEAHVVTPDGTEHEMDVADDGRSLVRGPLTDQDDADDLAEQSRLVQQAQLDYQQAAAAAAKELGGAELGELELEFDDGQVVWGATTTIEDQGEQRVRIDAVSGAVLATEYDD